MRVYVEKTYVTAVDIDPCTYTGFEEMPMTREQLIEAASEDPDFWECLSSDGEPDWVYDADWEVVDDIDWTSALDEVTPDGAVQWKHRSAL